MKHVHVVIEITVKSTKNYQTTWHKNTGVPSSWFRFILSINLIPYDQVWVKNVQIYQIWIISTAQNVDFILISRTWMTPSRHWLVVSDYFLATYFGRLSIWVDKSM